MQYDLLLMPRTPGEPWEEAVAAARAGDGRGLDPILRAQRTEQFERIVARLRELLGEVLAGTDDDPEDDSPAHLDERDELPSFYGEARHPETGLHVCLYETSATVGVPLEEQQEDPEQFVALAREVVTAVAQETGWAVFDPQTGEAFDGTLPLPDGRQDLPEPPQAATAGAPGATGAAAPRPAAGDVEATAQRRRARRYLAVGAVVAPVGLWLVLNGGGFFAWLALVIGLADLVVGYRAWRAAPDPG